MSVVYGLALNCSSVHFGLYWVYVFTNRTLYHVSQFFFSVL